MAGFKEYAQATALSGGLTIASAAIWINADSDLRDDHMDCMQDFEGTDEATCLELVEKGEDGVNELMGYALIAGIGGTAATGYGAYKRRDR